MTRKSSNICPQDCPNRTATCHAECEIYLAWFRKNAEEIKTRADRVPINNYVVESIRRMKSGQRCTTDRYRPKGRW